MQRKVVVFLIPQRDFVPMKIKLRQLQSLERHHHFACKVISSVESILSQDRDGYFHCQKATLKDWQERLKRIQELGRSSFNLLIWCHFGSSESVVGLVRDQASLELCSSFFSFFCFFPFKASIKSNFTRAVKQESKQ